MFEAFQREIETDLTDLFSQGRVSRARQLAQQTGLHFNSTT